MPKQTDSLRWISIRASTPSCLWRLVDARLHLVLIELMALALNDIKRSKMFKDVQRCSKASNHTKLSTSKELFGGSMWFQSQETWDNLGSCSQGMSLVAPPDGPSSGFCRPGPFVSSGKKDLWQWKIHRLHMVFLESPWGKLQFLTPPQKSNTHGRNKTI